MQVRLALSTTELRSDLSDEAVELLLGLEPLDFLVDSFVLLELLQVGPATVEVRAETKRQTENEGSKLGTRDCK